MSIAEKSLRLLVEKWLTPTPATPIRVTRFSRKQSNLRRYVRVEALRPQGMIALFSSSPMTVRDAYSRLNRALDSAHVRGRHVIGLSPRTNSGEPVRLRLVVS